MAPIVVYRADGTEVVRRTRWQRVKLAAVGLLGAAVLLALLAAAIVVGLVVALPLVAVGLLLAARMYWQVRVGRRPE
jgi:hypothetical protein